MSTIEIAPQCAKREKWNQNCSHLKSNNIFVHYESMLQDGMSLRAFSVCMAVPEATRALESTSCHASELFDVSNRDGGYTGNMC